MMDETLAQTHDGGGVSCDDGDAAKDRMNVCMVSMTDPVIYGCKMMSIVAGG